MYSHKPRENTFVLVGTVLKKPEFLRPSRDVQNVCAVVGAVKKKGGTDSQAKLRGGEDDKVVHKSQVLHTAGTQLRFPWHKAN